jgi:hypothetical protein
MKKISSYRELLTTIVVILICLILYRLFPTKNNFQQIISSAAFLLIIPLLYIKMILKRPLGNFGIQLGLKKKGLILAALSIAISALAFYVLLQYTSLPERNNLPKIVTENFWFFLFYEIFLVGLFTVLYEFFFRGFVMFSLSRYLGYWAVVIQFLIFSAFFLTYGVSDWSIYLYLIVSLPAGLTAFESRSLIYSFAATLIFIIIADALFIGLAKQ